jgi:hypothetical protein
MHETLGKATLNGQNAGRTSGSAPVHEVVIPRLFNVFVIVSS